MLSFPLVAHPEHPPHAVRGVDVSLSRHASAIRLSYRAIGGRLAPLASAEPARTDGLWRRTCFELFLLLDDDERYLEFNFSPSRQWAAYTFDGYRDGMASLPLAVAPVIAPRADGVDVRCDPGALPHGGLRLGLSAVIEEVGGAKSYWALAHPPGAPDFHHAACFVARLPAPDAA